MPFTVQQVLNDARVLHRKTQEEAMISTGGFEVVNLVNRSLQGIYAIGARVNPGYHGKRATLEDGGDPGETWVRPLDAELIFLVHDERELPDGKVLLTSPEEPVPDPERPCLVAWGGEFHHAPGSETPDGTLTAWYSRRPTLAESLEGVVDLEDAFRALLVTDLGSWFAHRDSRWDELGILAADRDHTLQLYVASLEHELVGRVRNVGQSGAFDTPSLVDLKQFLLSAQPAA
jgi:hypothetical protein